MKKALNYLTLFGFIILIIIACGNSSDKTSANLKSENPSKEKPRIASSNNCLEKFHGKPEELLTKDLVGNFIDFEGADVNVAKVSEQIIRDIDFAQVNCKVSNKIRGAQGFGFDPIFIPYEMPDKTFGELTTEEKNKISHRGKALAHLISFLKEL